MNMRLFPKSDIKDVTGQGHIPPILVDFEEIARITRMLLKTTRARVFRPILCFYLQNVYKDGENPPNAI